MNLNIEEWKEFAINDLFPILQNGKANQGMLDDGNECFYIGAKKNDNGVMIHCSRDENLIQKGNCIIFICNGQGSVGYANYMDVDFIGTTDIVAGYNDNLNRYNGLFIATILCKERPKYSFGRKWKTHLRDTIIKLPVVKNNDGSIFLDVERKYSKEGYLPDWMFMECYIKSLRYKNLTTANKSGMHALDVENWVEFRFGDWLREVYKASAINKDELTEPLNGSTGIRYITRTAEDNGCEMIASLDDLNDSFIEAGNALTIGDTTATCFYQDERFITGDHMVVVRADWLNKYTGLFIVALLTNEQYKYSYGRAYLMDRIKDTMLKLPARREDGVMVPDWDYMENYIKNLPYGDRL